MLKSIDESLNIVPSSATKAPRPESTSSTSSGGSNKRKSFEDPEEVGNEENNSPNVPRKNTNSPVPQSASKKFKDALLSGSSALQNGANLLVQAAAKSLEETGTSLSTAMSLRSKTTASALPRFNPTVKRITMVATASQETKKMVTEQNTAERAAATPAKAPASARKTPGKKDGALVEEKTLGPNSSCNALIKRLKKAISNSPSPEVIRAQFDTGFSINEERVATIFAHLKVKNKWDYKEKSKKQDAVIKELRDCLTTTFGEIKSVREQCLMQENHTNNLIRDSYEELLEVSQNFNALHATLLKAQHDLNKAQEELRSNTTTMMKCKTEVSPLRNRAKEHENRIIELQAQLVLEQAQADNMANDYAKVQAEYAELKVKSETALAALKEEYEQRIEKTVAGYRDEVAALRADLKHRQTDADRYNSEKNEVDRRRSELEMSVQGLNSRVRELESKEKSYEKEVSRLEADLERTRADLAKKEESLLDLTKDMMNTKATEVEERARVNAENIHIRKRVEEIEEVRSRLSDEVAALKQKIVSLERDLTERDQKIADMEAEVSVLQGQARGLGEILKSLDVERELRQCSEMREEAERRERIATSAQNIALQTENANRLREVEEKKEAAIAILQTAVNDLTRERDAALAEGRKEADRAAGLAAEVQSLHKELEKGTVNHQAAEEVSRMTGELEKMRRMLDDKNSEMMKLSKKEVESIAALEEKLRVAEAQRRKLHNLVQELRGNVRVFARVRPFLPNDGYDLTNEQPSPTIVTKSDLNLLTITRPAGKPDEKGEDQSFTFDKVFGPTCTQEALFDEVSEFVQSALDGYNVCLFSYGQTGSGKTHTMQGLGNGPMRGVIPRAMQQVGMYKTQLEQKGWEYSMEVSFIEIYNENIRDLLRANASDDAKHEIKHGPNGTTITDVTMRSVDPNDMQQIDSIMEQAARHRSVGKTDMNERSSRSHSVFCLHLKAVNAAQGVVLKGTLSLVDLAGSERLDRSGATGEQLKETVAINKSLSALADVFVAIGNKQAHIPFRNSKLTYLLQPALSGDGKTLMMVNLSPTQESFQESLCSLRLAKQINQCELGKPKKQIKEASAANLASTTSSKAGGNPVQEAIVEPSTPSRGVPNTPSRTASKQMSASLSTATTLASAATATASTATPQLMTASLGGRRAAPSASASASSLAAKKAKK